MAECHANHGSVRTRTNSRNLAESLSNVIENDSLNSSQVLTDQMNHESPAKHLEELTEISNSSSEAVIQRLAKEGSQKLNRMRDIMLTSCISKWPECPKEKLCRRITRTGGRTAAEKIATDIVILTKYGSSGELSDELLEIFQKSKAVGNVSVSLLNSSLSTGGSQTSSEELTKTVFLLLENMDLKLCEAKENYLESIADMTSEVELLKARLLEKDSKIDLLESEIDTIKGRYKIDYQLLRGKYEDCKLEIEVLKENQTKLEQKYANLKNVDRGNNKSTKHEKRNPSSLHTNNGPDGISPSSQKISLPRLAVR